jgi:S1-C subfamily serine protease
LIVVAVALRSFGGSSTNRFPDPAVDVALGVAAQTGLHPAQPLRAPAAVTSELAVASSSVTTSTAAVANHPPPTAPLKDAAPTALAPTSPAPSVANVPLTTAQIVARWEPSVALAKGQASSRTGFIVKPGIVVTNAHVIDDEFMSGLEVRFPSAPAGKQGPLAAEFLYEDPKRDLAFLAVSTDLPATDIAPNYSFGKGEDITVIGNPGLGDEVVLENAISRGVMSSKTVIEGMNYLQLSMSINPGNSGGPVFDSGGRVIGVATLNAAKAEALAFCIPVEELQAAVAQVGPPRPDLVSRHRAQVGFKLLTVAAAIYGIGLDIRAGLMRKAPAGGKANLLPNEGIQKLDETLTTLDDKLFSLVDGERCLRSRPTRPWRH